MKTSFSFLVAMVSLELFALDKTDFDVMDIQVHSDSYWCGKKLSQLNLPEDIVVSTMVRGKKIVSPRGNTIIQKDDILFIMGEPSRVEYVISNAGAELPESVCSILPQS